MRAEQRGEKARGREREAGRERGDIEGIDRKRGVSVREGKEV